MSSISVNHNLHFTAAAVYSTDYSVQQQQHCSIQQKPSKVMCTMDSNSVDHNIHFIVALVYITDYSAYQQQFLVLRYLIQRLLVMGLIVGQCSKTRVSPGHQSLLLKLKNIEQKFDKHVMV